MTAPRYQYHLHPPAGLLNPLVQPGELAYYPSGTAPAGWLKADGSYYNPVDYPALYQVIGYRHGKDAQGRFRILEVIDIIQSCNPNLGDVPFTTSSDGVRGHNHSAGSLGSAGSHNHTVTELNWFDMIYNIRYVSDGQDNSGDIGSSPGISYGNSGSHTHGVTATGGGGVETVPKHVVLSLYVCALGDSLGYIL